MNKLTHVAVIADGNGRWAERRGLERSAGHEQGLNKVEDMMHWCVDIGIPVLSVYCFSWENWSRPKEEVDALFELANRYFERYREFAENNIRVVISGTRERVPAESIEKMERIQREARKRFELPVPQPYEDVQPLVIRANVGATVQINFDNKLDRRASIHVRAFPTTC